MDAITAGIALYRHRGWKSADYDYDYASLFPFTTGSGSSCPATRSTAAVVPWSIGLISTGLQRQVQIPRYPPDSPNHEQRFESESASVGGRQRPNHGGEEEA